MILCQDDSLYTGISTDIARRYQQHSDKKGAKYFRGHQPKTLIFVESGHSHSSAAKQESQIKKLRKAEKLMLIHSTRNELPKTHNSKL